MKYLTALYTAESGCKHALTLIVPSVFEYNDQTFHSLKVAS